MTEPRWFEYQIGLYVESEAEAWEKLQPVLRAAHEIDAENEESSELVGQWEVGGPKIVREGAP